MSYVIGRLRRGGGGRWRVDLTRRAHTGGLSYPPRETPAALQPRGIPVRDTCAAATSTGVDQHHFLGDDAAFGIWRRSDGGGTEEQQQHAHHPTPIQVGGTRKGRTPKQKREKRKPRKRGAEEKTGDWQIRTALLVWERIHSY